MRTLQSSWCSELVDCAALGEKTARCTELAGCYALGLQAGCARKLVFFLDFVGLEQKVRLIDVFAQRQGTVKRRKTGIRDFARRVQDLAIRVTITAVDRVDEGFCLGLDVEAKRGLRLAASHGEQGKEPRGSSCQICRPTKGQPASWVMFGQDMLV